jgi:hypothetical protein
MNDRVEANIFLAQGKRDVVGKSHDSRAQAESDR